MKARGLIYTLVPVVVVVASAAGPATAGAVSSADVSLRLTTGGDVLVANNGPSPASNVNVTETWSQSFDAGLARFWGVSTNNEVPASCVTPRLYSIVLPNGTAAVTCTMPSLGPGQQEAIYARWDVGSLSGKQAAITFTATATSSTPDPNLANNTASRRLVYFDYFGLNGLFG